MNQLSRSLNRLFKAPKAPSQEQKKSYSALAKAKRLADKHGITIEKDGRDYWVTVESLRDQPNDPCAGNQFCTCGSEVLEVVNVYVEFLGQA